MKFKTFLSVIFLFSLVSCASFKDKYSCNTNLLKVQNQQFRYCSVNGSSPVLYGAAKGNSDEWLVEPRFIFMSAISDKELYLSSKADELLVYNFKNNKIDNSEYINIRTIPNEVNQNANKQQFFEYPNGDVSPINYDTGKATNYRIKNVDKVIYTESGHPILPYYTSSLRGLLVRHSLNNKKFYKLYTNDGRERNEEFLAEDMILTKTDAPSRYLFLNRVNKELDLYWPIFYDGSNYLKQPEDVLGFVRNPVDHWKSAATYDKWSIKVSDSGLSKIYFRGQNGQPDYIAYANFDFSKIKDLKSLEEVIDKARKSENRSYDYSWTIAKTSFGDGTVQSSKFIILKNKDDKYGYSSGHYIDDKEYIYGSKEAALLAIRTQEANATVTAIEDKKKHESQVLKDQAMRNQFIAADNAEAQKIRDEQAASARHNEEIRKAENAKVWDSVSEQIKGAGARAKTKGDCIKKNTQTKKDYLDKKQGWYTTGGCETY